MQPAEHPAGTGKVVLAGTHRVRQPEDTWDLIAPRLPRFGITRVADITGLDVLGVPVATATRPLASTLTVSQGKGQTYLLAKVSAVMEGIELWHAEHVRPPVAHRAAAAVDLELAYAVEEVATLPGSLVDATTRLDWITATGLCRGGATPLPAELARLGEPDRGTWTPPGLPHSSNGLASGNSRPEATLHGLYEVLERDALGRLGRSAAPVPVDPGSIPSEAGADLVDRIRTAGAQMDLVQVGDRFGVPTYAARIWSADFPVSCLGYGAHLSAEVAASRAITEAAQSRLTTIAGSRDDLTDIYATVATADPRRRPATAGEPVAWPGTEPAGRAGFADVARELAWLAERVRRVTDREPLVVDLSTEPDFAVVKVVVPGAGFDRAMIHPGGSAAPVDRLFGRPG